MKFELIKEGEPAIGLLCYGRRKEVILVMNPKTPMRTVAIRKEGPSPIKYFQESIDILNRLGASFIAFPSNTVHYFFQFLHSDAPIVSMITETAKKVKEEGHHSVGLLATSGTIETRIYHNEFEKFGIDILTPKPSLQETNVMEAIFGKNGAKAGRTTGTPRKLLYEAAEDLVRRGAKVLILGCTEIPLVLTEKIAYFKIDKEEYPVPLIDPTQVLANSCREREGIAGIAGGHGPAATVDFLRKMGGAKELCSLLGNIIKLTPYNCDQDHYKVIGVSTKCNLNYYFEKISEMNLRIIAARSDMELHKMFKIEKYPVKTIFYNKPTKNIAKKLLKNMEKV